MNFFQDKEFKQALAELPDKEKDKLILRLLKHDDILTKRLYFELLDPYSTESRRSKIKEVQLNYLKRYVVGVKHTIYLHGFLRELSGIINEHVAVTKDKYGEIELNLFMTITCLELYNELIEKENYNNASKFTAGLMARIFKIMQLIIKLHEDLAVDFREDLERLAQIIQKNSTLTTAAKHHHLELDWLIHFDIPTDIGDIAKQLRARGLLK